MNPQNNFSHAATVLPVLDIQKSIEFYTQRLQFELMFSWGEPLSYVVLKQGGVSLHLTLRADNNSPSTEHCVVYIFVRNIEEIYQQCLQENVTILNPLELRDYKMKDFDIKDPDGHIISFGNGQ